MLEQWIGKTDRQTDTIDLGNVNRLRATLEQPYPLYRLGDELPPAWHWLYFNPNAGASELGPDGHPDRGGFLPPIGLPRRMWAGTRLQFRRPIYIGETLERTSTIRRIERKSGSSGELCFITIAHEIHGPDRADIRLVDEQDLVYRAAARADKPPPTPALAPTQFDRTRTIEPNSVMLFRYSAVTFNGHRIHYDLDFCRTVEGYPGLVVHGPLTATWILELAREFLAESGKTLATFNFRAISPLFHDRPFSVCLATGGDDALELWATNADGGLAMRCTATLR